MISYLFILFLVIVNTSQRQLNLPEGSPCSTDYTTSGVCTLIANCPAAYKMIENRQTPTTCSFKKIQPIVCCPAEEKKEPDIPIHVKKCQEYGSKVFVKTRKPGLIPSYYNRSLCAVVSKSLVFGGEDANPKEFPHMALVGYEKENEKQWDCGGSLISENFVLTAAHCLYHWDFGFAQYVRLGDLDIVQTNDVAQPQEIKVIDRIYHPNYKAPVQYDDIGLLKLEKNAVIDAFVRPICLYSQQTPPDKFLATGWGATEHDDSSDILQKVTLELYSQEKCSLSYKSAASRGMKLPTGIFERTQICAGGAENEEKDTCPGDSGGPLQIYNNDVYCMYYIVGVTSIGKDCGAENSPGVYTRVSAYIGWIESVVWGA